MKKMYNRFSNSISIGLIALFLQSCASSYIINRSYTPIDGKVKTYPKPTNVDLYFVGEQPKFAYEKLAVVQVTTSPTVDKMHLFSHLKYEAWKNGADALINVSENDQSSSVHTKYGSYTVVNPFVQGIAIKKLPENNNLLPENQPIADTSFVNVVNQDNALISKSNDNAKSATAALVVLTIVFLLAIIVIAVNSPKSSSSTTTHHK